MTRFARGVIISAFLSVFGISGARAAITPDSISVSSYTNPVIDGVTKATLYVGYADTTGYCATGGDGVKPCDSCARLTGAIKTLTNIACNSRNVYGTLPLVISFSVNDATKVKTGTSVLKTATTAFGEGPLTEATGTTASSGIAANTTLTVKILWSSIFTAASAASPPTTSFTYTFYVGIAQNGASLASTDEYFSVVVNFRAISAGTTTSSGFDPTLSHTDCANTAPLGNEGVCGFSVRAGDSKVYIDKLLVANQASWSTPGDGSGVSYNGVRVYYQKGTAFGDIDLATAGYVDLGIDSAGTLSQKKINNLENDNAYVFLVATTDQAGNVTGFSSRTYLESESTYIHHATPGQVVGLLDGKKCFIATAAFGSEMAPQVEAIRQFRNKFLLPHGWGRSFVRWYYEHSPSFAEYIAEHETLRGLVRGALWPVVVLSSLMVDQGPWVALFAIVVAVLFFKAIYQRVKSLQLLWKRRKA